MHLFLCESIKIGERQRSEVKSTNIGNLKDSIGSPKGLLQAPVVSQHLDGTISLVAGMTRLAAIKALHAEKRPFTYDGQTVPEGYCPCALVTELSIAELLEAELDENIIRTELSWQDRTKALAAIHNLRKEANPSQTIGATAQELADKAGRDSNRGLRTELRNAEILAKNLYRPSVSNARNATEALGILLKEEEAKMESELIRRRNLKMDAAPKASLIEVRHGDFTQILPSLPKETVDLILADLPYGINAGKGGFRQRTVEHHNYEDTPEAASSLMRSLISEGFRVCKPRANLFIFGDIDLFPLFKQACGAMGWTPFRTPIIWRKSESEGLAPWGREGFRRTYEMIFFATKGKRGLSQSPVDILDESRVPRHLRRYGPEKPAGLMFQLIECSTLPGDFVLDPCCGSGATLIAARHAKRKALGIELNEAAYHLSVVAAERDPEGSEKPTTTEDLA